MAHVLRTTGLHLRDEYISHQIGSGPCPFINTLVVGMARMCNYSHIAKYAIEPCAQGKTTLTFVLQAYQGTDGGIGINTTNAFELLDRWEAPWDSCVRELEAAARGTSCHMLIVRQWFWRTPGEPRPCAKQNPALAVSTARVMAQTIAVGRGWEWARRFHPSATAYARTRLDTAWCLPNIKRETRRLIVTDANAIMLDGTKGVRQASDVFGLVTVDGARAYFEAWRVWREIDCKRICFAGGAETRACNIWLSHMCTGENPLSMWLCDRFGGNNRTGAMRVDWRRDGFRPPAFIRPHSATHVSRRRNGAAPIHFVMTILNKRRKLQCPSCTPGCMYPPKLGYAVNSPKWIRNRMKLGPGASLVQITDGACRFEWQHKTCAAAAHLRDMQLRSDPPTLGPGAATLESETSRAGPVT